MFYALHNQKLFLLLMQFQLISITYNINLFVNLISFQKK